MCSGFHGGGFGRWFWRRGRLLIAMGFSIPTATPYPQPYPLVGVAAASAQNLWYFWQPAKPYYAYV
jgi:hypothetical protein